MKTIIVLAAHGAPPTDYPPKRVGMLMALEFGGSWVKRIGFLRARQAALDQEVRSWRRTTTNDPYKNGVEALAQVIAEYTHNPVLVGYNEFCQPTIPEAIDQAVQAGAMKVIVASTMLTRGGDHSENEIREIVQHTQTRYPAIQIKYAWPFELERIAKLFADELARF